MAAWSQILQIVGNSTLFYLSFDTHDSPGSVFVYIEVQIYYRIWKYGKNLSQMSLCALSLAVLPEPQCGVKFAIIFSHCIDRNWVLKCGCRPAIS